MLLAILLLLILLLIVIGILPIALHIYATIQGAPFVRSHDDRTQTMLKLANIKPGDHVIDLGAGDGKLLIAAAQLGATGLGYEINPLVAWIAARNIKKQGLQDKVQVIRANFWFTPLPESTHIFIFGIPYIMERLSKKITQEAQPRTVILSNAFPLPSYTPTKMHDNVYLYTT